MDIANHIPPRLARAHAASLAGLAHVEANARPHLHAAARAAVRGVGIASRKQPAEQALTTAAGDMEARLASGIVLVRAASRGTSRQTLAEELRALEEAEFDLDSDEYIDEDEAAAAGAGKSFSSAWLLLALLLLLRRRAKKKAEDEDGERRVEILWGSGEDGADAAVAAEAALDQLGYRIDATAITEVAVAFNREREASLATTRRRGLYKRWDATLDRGTCERCERLNGTVVRAHELFPSGAIPGLIHIRCRCIETLVPASALETQ